MASRDGFLPPNDTGFDAAPAPFVVTTVGPAPGPARRRVDMRWGRVDMAQLADDDFLQKQQRRLEIAASARSSGRAEEMGRGKSAGGGWEDLDQDHLIRDRIANARARAARGVPGDQENEDGETKAGEAQAALRSARDQDDEEKRELANALCIIAELDSAARAELIQQRLTAALRQQCVFPNPVYKLIALRRKIMRHVQAAVALQHQQRAAAVSQWTTMADAVRQVVASSTPPNRQAGGPARSATEEAIPFAARAKGTSAREASIGLQALSWMLASLRDSNMLGAIHKRELVLELLQLLSSMPRLALGPHRTQDSVLSSIPGVGGTPSLSEDMTLRDCEIGGLVDTIHEFLLDVSPKPTLRCGNPVSPKVQAVASANADIDIDSRTNAVNALAHLAGASGSVRDFLVLIKVLLGVSDISHEPATLVCPCSSTDRVIPSPRSVYVLNDPISEHDRCAHVPDVIEFEPELRAKLRSEGVSPGELTTRKLQELYPDGIDTSVDGEKTSPNCPRKAGTKPFGCKAVNPVVVSPVLSPSKASLVDASTTQRSRTNPASASGSSIKSRQRVEYTEVVLPTGSLSGSTDTKSMRRESKTRANAIASGRAETPQISARCPKLKPLQVHSVIQQLEEAEPAPYQQTFKSRLSNSSGGSIWYRREADCVDTGEDDDEREVWSCGQNSYGELGHGDTISRKSFERIESLQGKNVVLLGAGNEHTIALSGDGKVYTCGYNDNGQCGQGGTTRVTHMTEIPKIGESSVVQVHAYNGCEHTIMILSSGRAATCGYNYRGQLGHGNTTSESVPKLIRSLENRIVRLVSCSYYHTVMTCEDVGSSAEYVMTFGRNDYGQLGHNDSIDRKVPQHVGALSDHHVVSVACGQYHTMVVTSNGKVFGFGKNDYGQLGIDSVENQLLPVLVRGALDKQTALEVRCGYYHSIVLCGGAHIFGFGRNDYGQLGLGKSIAQPAANIQLQQQRFSQPYLLEELEGKEIVRFACGCYHTVAVSESGMMYVFGRNNHGQLGTGDTNERLYPFPIDDFLGKRVALVAAGFYHTIVLTGGNDNEKEDQDKIEDGLSAASHREKSDYTLSVSFADILSSPVMVDFLQNQRSLASHLSKGRGLHLQFDFDDLSPSSDSPGQTSASQEDDFRDEDVANSLDQAATTSPESDSGDKPKAQPDHLQGSVVSSSASESVKLAAFVFAQLDRLCQNLLPKQGILPPSSPACSKFMSSANTGATTVDLGLRFPGGFEPYVVHVRSATLEHLCSLLLHLNQRKADAVAQLQLAMASAGYSKLRDQVTGVSKTGSTGHGLQLYMLLVCVRLLRANMVQLLRSGIAQVVLAYSADAPSTQFPAPTKATGFIKEIETLKRVFQIVRDALVSIIDSKYHKNSVIYEDASSDIASRVILEATNTLMESFEVFFPCPCLQTLFCEHVLRDSSISDPTAKCWCSSLCQHGLQSGGVLLLKSKKLVLVTLVRRLMDDTAVIKLMPFSLAPSLLCSPRSNSTQSGESLNTRALRFVTSTYQALLQHVRVDFDRQLLHGYQHEIDDQQEISSTISALQVLQKHIMCWALGCTSWQSPNNNEDQEFIASRSMQELVASIIDSSFRVDGDLCDSVPLPWRAMIEFALSITAACCQAIVQICVRPPKSVAALTLLERSFVGQMLPSLVTALFEFSNKPLFVAALLPNTKGLLKLLDDFNQQFAALKDIDKAFVESVALQFSGGNNGGRGPSTSGFSAEKDPVSGLTRIGTARLKQLTSSATGQPANVSDALALPWNYRLEKELAVLTAEMAVTLTIGEPLVQWSTLSPLNERPHGAWFLSPLLRGGLNPSFISKSVKMNLGTTLTSASRRTVTHSPFPTAASSLPSSICGEFQPFSLILPAISASDLEPSTTSSISTQNLAGKAPLDIRRYRRVFSRAALRRFLLALGTSDPTSGDEWAVAGYRLCEWIKTRYAQSDPSYRMLLQMSNKAQKASLQEDQRDEQIRLNDGRIELSVFAALVHHNALALQAFHFALIRFAGSNSLQQARPPSSFLKLWRFVADLRRQVASKKTAIRNQQHPNSADDVEGVKDAREQIIALQQMYLERCELLLLVDIHDEEAHAVTERDAGFVGPQNPAFITAACAKYALGAPRHGNSFITSMAAHLQARYTDERLPFLVAFPWSKWRRVRVLVHTITRWKASGIKSTSVISANISRSSPEANITDVSRHVVRFVSSNDSVSSPSAIREFLVDPCRRRSCSARGFEIIWELLATVSYDSIQADLVHQVTQALVFRAQDGPPLTGHRVALQNVGVFYTDMYNNALSDFLMQLTELIADKVNAAADVQENSGVYGFWILGELLASWGMKFEADQFEFVSDIGVLPLIHRLLRVLPGAELLDAEKARGIAAPTRTNSLVIGADRSSYTSESPRGADSAALKSIRLLHRMLWTIFQSVCANFAAPWSTQQMSSGLVGDQLTLPANVNAVVSPALSEPLAIVYAEALCLSQMAIPNWQQKAIVGEDTLRASSTPRGIRRSFDLLDNVTRLSCLHRHLTFEYNDMLTPPSEKVPMSPLTKPNEFSITLWMFIRGNPSSCSAPSDELATQPLPERQIVFVRGDGSELGPYLMIVPDSSTNWQLEVGFALHLDCGDPGQTRATTRHSNVLSERILSKDSIPTDRWVHIAVVVEVTKVRLYFNGVLDSQRTITNQYAAAWATRDVSLPFYFGRFPVHTTAATASSALDLLSVVLSPSKSTSFHQSRGGTQRDFGCFDGWLSQFRFHNRALSPIHVRIVYDELKPSAIAGVASTSRSGSIATPLRPSPATDVQHTRLLDLHALLIQLSSSPEGVVHFRNQFVDWFHLVWRTFQCSGSFQLQQSSLRVLQSLLPYQEPVAVSRALFIVAGSTIDNAEFGLHDLDGGFVQQILRIIGLGLMNIQKIRVDESESAQAAPWPLMVASGVHGSTFAPTSASNDQGTTTDVKLPSDIVRLETLENHRNLFIVNELTDLLVHLYTGSSGTTGKSWKTCIRTVITTVLTGAPSASSSSDNSSTDTELQASWRVRNLRFGDAIVEASAVNCAEMLGCLYLLSGTTETSLRPGATAQLKLTCDPVRVIAIEASSLPSPIVGADSRAVADTSSTDKMAGGMATCIALEAGRPPNQSIEVLKQTPEKSGGGPTRCERVESISVRCDELLPPCSAGLLISEMRDEMPALDNIGLEHALLERAKTVCPKVCEQLAQLNGWPGITPSPSSRSPNDKGLAVSSVEQSLQIIQLGNTLLRCLTQGAQRESFALEILNDEVLVSTIFTTATEKDSGAVFDTLENIERKAFRLRQRIHSVLIDMGDEGSRELASNLESSRAAVDWKADGSSEQEFGLPIHLSEQISSSRGENLEEFDSTHVHGVRDSSDDLKDDQEDEDEAEEDENIAGDSGDELGNGDDEDEDPDEDSEMEEHRAEFVDELMLMGFPEEWCVLALKQTENDIVGASAWIVDNLDYLSKLQISLDKKRELDRDSPRFNEDDDDVPDVDSDGLPIEPNGSPFYRLNASFRGGAEANAGNHSQLGLELNDNSTRAKSGIDKHQLDRSYTEMRVFSPSTNYGQEGFNVATADTLDGPKKDEANNEEFLPPPLHDKEMGRKIFGEMYFPFEEGGYLSNESVPFQSVWRSDNVELKTPTSPKSDVAMTQPNQQAKAPVFTDSSFEAEVSRLDVVAMVDMLRALERQLMVLYCRLLAVTTLKHMESAYQTHDCPGQSGACRALPVSFSQVLNLLKFVIKRGDQFDSHTAAHIPDRMLSAEEVMSRVVMFMLARNIDKNIPLAVAYVLEQVENAAWSKQFEAFLWTQRELRRPDEQVIAEPAVEIAVWLIDRVFDDQETPVRTSLALAGDLLLVKSILQRLRCSLGATNLSLKCFALRTISRLLLVLSRSIGDRNKTADVSCNASKVRSLVINAKLTAREVIVAAKQRLARETIQQRQLYSLYLQAYVELLHALNTIYSSGPCDESCDEETQGGGLLPISTFDLGTTSSPDADKNQCRGSLESPGIDNDFEHPMAELVFDHKRNRSGLLAYSEDGSSVAYSGNDAWKATSAEKGFSTGQHAWSVRIDKSNSSYIFVGVATHRLNVDSFLGSDDQSWGFIGDKALYYQRNRVRAFGEAFGEGDTIGVHLDCERGTLGFTKNGLPFGIAFDNVVGHVYPAVALYSRHQRVSLAGDVAFECMDSTISLENETDSKSQLSQQSLPLWASDGDDDSSGRIDDCLVACELMVSMLERRPIRSELMNAAYQLTTHWLAGRTQYVTTWAGWSLWVDVTKESCERFGFRAGERVRTARGNGTVAGVACGRVWVHVDGEPGAWFFHPSKLRVLSIAVLSTGKLPSSPSNDGNGMSAPNRTQSNEPGTEQVGDIPTSMLLDEFTSHVHHSWWGGVAHDRELLRVVNDHCESTRTSPWNVSPAALLQLIRDKQQQQPGLLDTAAGSFALGGDEPSSCTRGSTGVSPSASVILVARFALLRYFNLALSRSLPFFDLTWRYYASRSSGSSGVSQPCRLLSACRGSVFLCLKNAFFTSLMQRTANSPRKAEDEYDYPDDLPHLQVNRLKAAAAKCHPGTTKSLFLSLFGQTFEVLHFLPLRTLRMVYSHPMDDGQLRCFKVKFEGEGADDYGGPYREFFSQFFAELQTLKENQEDTGSNQESNQHKEAPMACLLPFLLPSPNWRSGVGSSREKFVLNASLVAPLPSGSEMNLVRHSLRSESPEEKRQLYRELFVFLGQMLGTCLRTGVCVRLDLATSVWKQLVAEDDATREVAADLSDESTEDALASLKEIDFVAYSLWRNLKMLSDEFARCCAASRSVGQLEEQLTAMDLDFTTTLSDGQTVELRRGGRSIPVTLLNLREYLRLMLNARVHEASEAVALLKRGLNSILPVSALALLTWQELETRVCGVDEIDVSLLRANTEYDEDVSPSDEFVMRFWRVLEGMDTVDRRAFLRFVWARSRLPLGAAQFHQKFKIQSLALGGSNGGDGGSAAASSSSSTSAPSAAMDAQLPKSHTCFFALQLPRYSSDDVCRKQLLYAVHNCVEMDGDFRLADTEMSGWTDVSAADQLRL
jgi:alpha-tubulin suppressor-like RCC1 family protein